MSLRKIIIIASFQILTFLSFGQIPPGYYDPTYGFNGLGLKITLHNIIKNHNVISYSALYSVLQYTDNKGNGIVWDIYSDNPYGNPYYTYNFSNPSDQCGQYTQEGDCYNKEHSWPHSWFGSSSIPLYSDLFNIYPTDGWVNNKRANFPYGKVNNPSWTSLNGSKLGPCVSPGYSGTAFEPINEYKGDIARSYFYIIVRYLNEDSGWTGSDMTIGADLKPWAFDLMYTWHKNDPVSQKETDRNDAIYALQNNRNPFIDHPEWIDSIYFPVGIPNNIPDDFIVNLYPNPASQFVNVSSITNIDKIDMFDALGKEVLTFVPIENIPAKIDLSALKSGYYYIHIQSKKYSTVKKIMKF